MDTVRQVVQVMEESELNQVGIHWPALVIIEGIGRIDMHAAE